MSTSGPNTTPAAREAVSTGRSAGFVGSRPFRLGLIAVILIAVYALFGFLAAPRWIHAAATEAVERSLGLRLGLGEISLNPFLLQLEVGNISLPDAAQDDPLVALDRLFIDLELSSLWNRALVFREIALGGPFARVIVRPDKSLNLSQLVPPPDPDAPAASAEEPALPALWIKLLDVSDGQIKFADRSRRMSPEKQLAPIEFALRDFRTNPEGGNAKLDARSEDGEGFEWEGRIALEPVSSDGRFSVTALKARTVYEFLSEELPLELSDGSIDLHGSYTFTLDPEARIELTVSTIEVDGLELKAVDAAEPWITIPAIAVDDIELSTADQSVHVTKLGIERPAVKAWLEPDGSLNLLRLAGPAVEASEALPEVTTTGAATADAGGAGGSEVTRTATPAEGPAAPAAAPAEPSAQPMQVDSTTTEESTTAGGDWTVELAELALDGAVIEFEDRSFTPPNPTKVAPLTLTARALSLDLSQRITLDLEATINDRGLLTASGELSPDPLSGDLDVAYENGSILVAQPYVARFAALTVESGRFDVAGKVALRPEGGDEPWVRFDGRFSAQDLHTVDNDDQQDLFNFDRLEIQGIEFALAPDRLSVKDVIVTKPFARVIIAPDQTINVVEVFATAPAATEGGSESAPVDAADPGSGGAFPIRIGKVDIKGGTLDFADLFIQPNFQAQVDALNGSITAMSSDPASKADIDLGGHVINEFSPVSIKGQMNLFSFDKFTDVDLEFRNIDLPVFNPYSGRFAGYAIARGKLTTELAYLIENRKLDAAHHIVLDGLEWGEATGSKDAVSIPIKLATALLKDRNGIIDLDFPVGGSLDDPSFRIGPVIWQIIRNLLVKIVTAPFAFIGSLFEGAEDAQFVTFAAGSAALSPDDAESLAALARALLERPQLKLDVPVQRMPELDAPALRALKYEREIGNATRIATGAAADTPVDFDALPPEQQREILSAVYTVLAGTPPAIPEAPPPPEGTSRADAKALAGQHALEYLEESSRALIKVGDDELQMLAEARAQAVQRALLEGASIDPARVFLTGSEKVTAEEDQVKLELGLE